MAPTTQFELAQPPNDAVSSLVFAPNAPSRLLASSWDKNLYLYDTLTTSENGDAEDGSGVSHGTLLRTYEHRAPVLDVCFGADDNEAFTAGMDWEVRRVDLESGEQTTVSKHTAPVRRVVYSKAHSLLISASWDSTLHIHNPTNPSRTPLTIPLPGKPHAMAASPSKVIVAMTSRLVHIYDLGTLAGALESQSGEVPAPWQQRESSLKFLTRAVAAMPSDGGYATSSIEGRVAVEWFDASAESQARKYAFKCHRQTDNAAAAGVTDVVYPVNALAFHPVHGNTFASAGGDATVALWDAEAKRRMKVYQKFADSVAAVAFSTDGRFLAVAVCPGFETGMEDYSGEGRTKIVIRELGENEARGKGAK
ncbi:cell cycle arrest protein BUB3 [Apiospora sp. TS-2023a]